MPNFSILSSYMRAAENNNSTNSNPILMYILMGVLILGFIGFFIWSNYNNKKQQKKHSERLRSIEPGTKVITRGGIAGVVESVNLEEGSFLLKTGIEPNVTYLNFVLEAIYLSGPEADNAAKQVAAKINATNTNKPQTAVSVLEQERKEEDKQDNSSL